MQFVHQSYYLFGFFCRGLLVIFCVIVCGEFAVHLLLHATTRKLSTVGMTIWMRVGVFNLVSGIDFVSGLITAASGHPKILVPLVRQIGLGSV